MFSSEAILQKWAEPFLLSWSIRRWVLSFCLGGLSALAFQPFGLVPVLLVTLPALVWTLDGASAGTNKISKERFLGFFSTGWWFSLGFFMAGLYWIGEAFLVEAETYAWMIPFAVTGVPAVISLFPALALALVSFFWSQRWERILLLAVALSLSDYARGHLFTGFPWNLWGYIFLVKPEFAQGAAIFGVYGLSLLAILLFTIPALLLGKSIGRQLMLVALMVLLFVGYGAASYVRFFNHPTQFTKVDLLVVQPNVPQKEKWKPENRHKLLPRYIEQTEGALAGGPTAGNTLIFWPESAFPYLLTSEPGALSSIDEMLKPGETLITGAIRGEKTSQGRFFYNSVYTIEDGNGIRDVYDKVHLVPFGEYLPYRKLLQSMGVDKLVPAPADFSSGFRYRTMRAGENLTMKPLICYEAIFPYAAMSPAERPDFIANITNDGWFGETQGPYQHFAQSQMRAIEQGVPIIRVANTGISGVMDPVGRVLAKIALNDSGNIRIELPKLLQTTIYSVWGDLVFLGVILSISGILLVIGVINSTRKD
ncbi:apolipoprotein N-acyltransferase [Flexibacterium corallicola]|uniref:apolipoprotein N-acyltransferase n=1 Tax=Flexibacterium corallicola TaxID=3037259 RepID=UPI00286F38F5|nr:apolipoprotein N-acyltransferase [Pseudovibrio sp. M1P-2-3]